MERDKIMLLAQLVDNLGRQTAEFERALTANDKRRFDSAKSGILEIHSQINTLIRGS